MASNSLSPAVLAAQLPEDCPGIWVACSGGLDSMVLLHLALRLRDQGLIGALQVLHVHHGLQVEADGWAEQLEALCRDWRVPLVIERAELSGSDNLEARARAERYRLFAKHLGKDEVLLLAHHRRDQAETLLYRLCRGTGPRGLAAMPRSRPLGRGQLLRPLLDCPREALEQYAAEQQLGWVEDPSNRALCFDRNFIRAQVLPALGERWPGAERQLARAANHCAEEQALLAEYARAELGELTLAPDGLLAELPALDWRLLAHKPFAKQKLLLRTWLADLGCSLPQSAQLERILSDLLTPRSDAEPCFEQPGWSLRRYRQGLYWLAQQEDAEPLASLLLPEAGRLPAERPLPGNGALVLELAGTGRGLAPSGELSLGYRSAELLSQRFALAGRQGRKSLKKWCQEAGIPPWLRDRLPLLFRADRLVAVAGVGVLTGEEAAPGQNGIQICWKPAWVAVNPD